MNELDTTSRMRHTGKEKDVEKYEGSLANCKGRKCKRKQGITPDNLKLYQTNKQRMQIGSTKQITSEKMGQDNSPVTNTNNHDQKEKSSLTENTYKNCIWI